MHSVSTDQCERVCFSGQHFADPVMSRLREWRQWRAPIGPAITWNCSHRLLDASLALWCGMGSMWLLLVASPALNVTV